MFGNSISRKRHTCRCLFEKEDTEYAWTNHDQLLLSKGMYSMKPRLLFILTILCLIFGLWNCEDISPTAQVGPVEPGIAHLAGVVYDVNTLSTLDNAKVYLALSDKTDSTVTSSGGIFRFEVDLSNGEAQSAVLTLKKLGFVTKSMNIVVSKDTAYYIGLQVDLSTSAIISGILRDSVTLYP